MVLNYHCQWHYSEPVPQDYELSTASANMFVTHHGHTVLVLFRLRREHNSHALIFFLMCCEVWPLSQHRNFQGCHFFLDGNNRPERCSEFFFLAFFSASFHFIHARQFKSCQMPCQQLYWMYYISISSDTKLPNSSESLLNSSNMQQLS